ncbi:MAG: hypothetical protein EWV57_02265, partial [Microcystis aeruginosa Ma_QC_Ch_20071001_S25D]
FGKIGCNRRLFVFLDKNNYFFKKTLFYFFVGYFILWKSLKGRGFKPNFSVNQETAFSVISDQMRVFSSLDISKNYNPITACFWSMY